MASRCGCGNTACSCLLRAGTGITVTGTGSQSSPYVITNTESGGGGSCPDPLTIAELVAKRDAGTLDPCASYRVTDWTTPNALSGPNTLLAKATATNELSPFVLVSTPLGESVGPSHGTFDWNAGFMTKLCDPLGNEVLDVGNTVIDSFPWGLGWADNKIEGEVTFTGGYAVTSAAALTGFVTLSDNWIRGMTLDLTGTTNGTISNCNISAFVSITAGTQFFINQSELGGTNGSPCTITNSAGSGQQLSIYGCNLRGGTYQMSNSGSLALTTCQFYGETTIITADTDSQMQLTDCRGGNFSITDSSTQSNGVTATNSTFESGATVANTGSGSLIILASSVMDQADIEVRADGPITISGSTVAGFHTAISQNFAGAISVTRSQILSQGSISGNSNGDISVENSSITSGADVTNSGTGDLTLFESRVINSQGIVANSTKDMIVEYSTLDFSTIDNTGTDRRVNIDRCTLLYNGNIDISITAALAFDGTYTFRRCYLMDSDVNVTGSAGPNDQSFDDLFIIQSSFLNVADPGGDVSQIVIDTASTLNVNAGGDIIASKFGMQAVVNTGAFSHDTVIVQAPGTVTLTASNSNTYKGFGANTLI